MLWILVIAITFSSVIVAEIGDKSQLMTISLASKYDKRSVFWGIFSGMGIITIVGVALGTIIFQYIPVFYVKISAALIFLLFGVHTIFLQDEEDEVKKEKNGGALTTSFFFAIIAELGDKTQLLVIALTARYGDPLLVLVGALTGLGTIIGLGVVLGSKLRDLFAREKIDLLAGLLFLILGSAFLIETLFFG